MTMATVEKTLLEGIINSLKKALAKASPDVFTALDLAETQLKLIAIEEERQAQARQSKRRRRKASGEVVNLRPAE